MNKRQHVRYKMILNVHTACMTFGQSWVHHDGFSEVMSQLSFTMGEISTFLEQQMSPTGGITQTKLQARVALADQIMLVAGGAAAFARSVHDFELSALMKINRSALLKIRDVQVLPIATTVYKEAFKKLQTEPRMAKYGVDMKMLDELRLRMDHFEHMNVAPRQAIGYRKRATACLEEQITEALSIIQLQLDGLILQMKHESPEFYEQYRRMRKMQGRRSQKEKVVEVVEEGEVVEVVMPVAKGLTIDFVRPKGLLMRLGLMRPRALVESNRERIVDV